MSGVLSIGISCSIPLEMAQEDRAQHLCGASVVRGLGMWGIRNQGMEYRDRVI